MLGDARVAVDWDDGGSCCGKEGGAEEVKVAREGEGEGEDEPNCFWRLEAEVFGLLLLFENEPLVLRCCWWWC